MSNAAWSTRDLNVLWHPCSQMKDHQQLPLIPISKGEGVWLEDFDGNRYIDAISSWWVNILGHCHPELNQALSDQASRLEHVILAGFSHPRVIELSEKLVSITPDGLDKCFYADNGSSAVEVALKMSYHYWRNTGQSGKTRFINLTNSYHGETLGALAVGDVDLYKDTYEPLLLKPLTAPSPDCYLRHPDDDWASHSRRMIAPMHRLLEQHAHETCAVIVEPLIQCAGAMRMYHPVYLTLLREACDAHGVHLILDEIATGFGRTGTLFAFEQAAITPDFLCLSKALTGGYLPLSAVLTSNRVYDAFYDDYNRLRAFLHSHSYTGNPLACAVALRTIDILQRDNWIARNRDTAAYMSRAVAHLADHPHVAEVRQHGMVLAIEMVRDKARRTPYDWQERRGLRVYQHGLAHGCLLRPLGNVVYFMPPYVITPEQIDHLARVATEGIDLATRD
jgi:adenosylmethionine-8-amino-7-oxononanoate aminotransferase